MTATIESAFAERLARLVGDDFQRAVCSVLAKNFHHFQPVVAKPSGDGGIDGISHDCDVIYCCYGLDISAVKQLNTADIKNQVADKFRADIRRIMELEPVQKKKKNGPKWQKAPNATIAGLWPAGRKAKHIKCICNWNEHSGVFKAINDHYADYKNHSDMTYVDASCTVTFLGPKDFVASVVVDEASLLRLEHSGFIKILVGPGTAPPAAATTSKFVQKFELLTTAHPERKQELEEMRDGLIGDWTALLCRLNQIENELPQIHEKVSKCIVSVARAATLETTALGSKDAPNFLASFTDKVVTRLAADLSDLLPPDQVRPFAEQIVAKLIGECPINWSSNAKPN